MKVEDLRNFEKDIEQIYETGKIRAPVHLRDGNESYLINIFKDIREEDYVFSTWASHSHALLKGVSPERVKQDILEGRSITLHYPDCNFYSSAIVGGIAPIALGVAYSLNDKQKGLRCFCFIGDMSFHTGIVNECIRYSIGHDLPIVWVVEDNGKSVGTDTEATCGIKTFDLFNHLRQLIKDYQCKNCRIMYYDYETRYPHSGTGVFVEF
jgi:TPP-dependent pyruvate/acetoin dehydrogenase alpha subunit